MQAIEAMLTKTPPPCARNRGSSTFALRQTGDVYSRTGNPTQLVLEQRLAALDDGVAALATGSGQSAVVVALLALARTGEHLVASSTLYGGTMDLLTDTFADFGIESTLVDPLDPGAWEAATGRYLLLCRQEHQIAREETMQ